MENETLAVPGLENCKQSVRGSSMNLEMTWDLCVALEEWTLNGPEHVSSRVGGKHHDECRIGELVEPLANWSVLCTISGVSAFS